MEVRICKNCKRMFKYIYGPELCPDCIKLFPNEDKDIPEKELKAMLKPKIMEDEQKFEQVRDYIMAHPKASIMQISEANDIKPMVLFEWVRQERLEFSDDSQDAWLECIKCGKRIKSGILCNRCKHF